MYNIINPNGMFSRPIQGALPDKAVQRSNTVAVVDTVDLIAEFLDLQHLSQVYLADFRKCGFSQVQMGYQTSTMMSNRGKKHKLMHIQNDIYLSDVSTSSRGSRRRMFEGAERGTFIYDYRISPTLTCTRVMLLYNGIWYPADIIYDADEVPVSWKCDYLPSLTAFNQGLANYQVMDYLPEVI